MTAYADMTWTHISRVYNRTDYSLFTNNNMDNGSDGDLP